MDASARDVDALTAHDLLLAKDRVLLGKPGCLWVPCQVGSLQKHLLSESIGSVLTAMTCVPYGRYLLTVLLSS